MNTWGITDIGLVRHENQDTYRIEELDGGAVLLVVCDGMGGARGGSTASSLAAEVFCAAVRRAAGSADRIRTLEEAVYEANAQVFTTALTNEELRGMGTTLVAALVTEDTLWVANVGDSRCYLVEEGAIQRLTRDHSLVEDLVLRGEITPEEARNHPKRNLITRALGVESAVKVDIFQRENRGGMLLLCSDGLSNMVTDEELRREAVAEAKESCCARLLRLALDAGATDNVTVVAAQL